MNHHFKGEELAATVKPIVPCKAGNLCEFYLDLLILWSAETCAPRMRGKWTADNPTCGQCSITAFLVQDYYGGEVFGVPLDDGNFHCYNVIDGKIFDLTNEQFGEKASSLVYDCAHPQSRAVHFGKQEKKERYEALKLAFEDVRK